MKTTIITAACMLCMTALNAQTTNKPATVRIKKVENINGVEKVTDTTFTTTDYSKIELGGEHINIEELKGGEGQNIKTIVINGDAAAVSMDDKRIKEEIEKAMKDAKTNGNTQSKTIIINDDNKGPMSDKELEELMEKALKDAGIDPAKGDNKKMIILNDDVKGGDGKHEEHRITKIMLVKCDITSCNEEDLKRINKHAGNTDGELKIERINFYPNPNNGKFNLSFDLAEKGDTEVMILNMEGKSVYTEKLKDFSGNYNKEIDISKNAKGVYFVRVEQGKHAQVKKVVIE